jgi:hypothetical protein
MKSRSEPRIINVDRLDNGVVVSFEDGKSALYPASLLLEMFDKAEDMKDKTSTVGIWLPE